MISVFNDFPFIHAAFCNAKESLSVQNPIIMNQVHGADVLILNDTPKHAPDCDALVTNQVDLKLTVKTADCAPVLFLDPHAKIIAATHAGWKGAFQGVLENTLLTMVKLGASVDNICAAIGPHLTKKSFQVSSDMRALFPATEQHFFESGSSGIYFDFTGYIQHRLKRVGVQRIDTFDIDTYSDLTYNSYRRDKQNPARQYSFIQINKGA
ncbi:MAG: peptidoglycan editing factor PgeF [Alphaproteobacteria bacterium]|nr:peptidoglycan editing factor PgeF [Alphaproteobacteria bacterium]